jgi:hypothetical protein
MSDAATIAVGSNNRHVAERLQRFSERDDSWTFYAVVVGDEDAQIRLPARAAARYR